jgi:hypothetical protein
MALTRIFYLAIEGGLPHQMERRRPAYRACRQWLARIAATDVVTMPATGRSFIGTAAIVPNIDVVRLHDEIPALV